MTTNGIPYFLTNKEWYREDEIEGKYVLTDKAPQEAIDSYNEFYKALETQFDEDFDETSDLGIKDSEPQTNEQQQVNKIFNLGE